jgi:hypothetical protein
MTQATEFIFVLTGRIAGMENPEKQEADGDVRET